VSFQQAVSNAKIDVLWVIDNSGSMASSQQNLTNNFPAFIDVLLDKQYDFKVAVTTTQAYLALPLFTPYYNTIPTPSYYEGLAQDMIAAFRDGVGATHSGFPILFPTTPNLVQNFSINATQGTNGRGDERSLQSLETALKSPLNSGFIRSDGFLAVVILTDEDDFSNDTTNALSTYTAALTPTDYYVAELDTLTGSSAQNRKYSVSTIAVKDQACLNSIFNGAQRIGTRVLEMAQKTGGVQGNICGDFADELRAISLAAASQATQFSLGNQIPIEASIGVTVNGSSVPNAATNPLADGGWSYNATNNSIQFIGQNYIPPQGAIIQVSFDPESLTF